MAKTRPKVKLLHSRCSSLTFFTLNPYTARLQEVVMFKMRTHLVFGPIASSGQIATSPLKCIYTARIDTLFFLVAYKKVRWSHAHLSRFDPKVHFLPYESPARSLAHRINRTAICVKRMKRGR